MVEFKVGAPFPMFKNHQKREGAVLEVSKEGGYFLPIYLDLCQYSRHKNSNFYAVFLKASSSC